MSKNVPGSEFVVMFWPQANAKVRYRRGRETAAGAEAPRNRRERHAAVARAKKEGKA